MTTRDSTLPGAAAPDPRTQRKYRQRWWTLAVLSLSLLIIGLDNTILNVALPTLQREFTSSASELQWMVDSYIVVFAGLLLTFGALGDRFGRARALQAGLVIFGLASFAAAYSQSAEQLIAARAVMGVGGAFIMPATLSILIDVFPKEERGRAISIWAGIAGLGIGLGPLAGGVLLEHFWWGSVFMVNVPIVIVALLAGFFLVPESRDPDATAIDLPGAFLSMGAVITLVYAIIEAPARGWLDPLVVGGFVAALVLGITFAVHELRTDAPMLDFRFFRNLRFSFGAAAIGFAFFSLFGMVFLLTQYLQFVRGYSALEAGYRLLPIALGIMAGASQSHRWVARFGTPKVVSAAMIGLALVMATMALWTTDTSYWIVGTVLFLMAAMMGNVMAPSTEAVMGALPMAKAGVGSAMNDLVRQVAGALGVAIIGSVVNTVYAASMEDVVATLPPQASGPAGDSVGAALRIATEVGGPQGEALAASASGAFMDSFGVAALIASGMVLAGSFLVRRYLPVEPAGAPAEPTLDAPQPRYVGVAPRTGPQHGD
jgi:EmrB/QacA subfamily drug resistance transporter